MEKLKIGMYVTFKDPINKQPRTDLLLNFDNNMMIVWHNGKKLPYPIPIEQRCELSNESVSNLLINDNECSIHDGLIGEGPLA